MRFGFYQGLIGGSVEQAVEIRGVVRLEGEHPGSVRILVDRLRRGFNFSVDGNDFTALLKSQGTQSTYNAGGVSASSAALLGEQGSTLASTVATGLVISRAGFPLSSRS